MTDLGELSLWMALLMAVWCAALSIAGAGTGREALSASGRRGLYAAWGFVALAAAALWWALLTGDFSLRYVATFTETSLPAPYRLSAFWAGAAGSMLTWSLSLSTCLALAQVVHRRGRELTAWVDAVGGGVLVLFLAVSALRLGPFARLATAVADGRGLDPALQHPAAALQPPLLYVGYMAMLVALIFAVVTLVRRHHLAPGLASARAWNAAACVLLLSGALGGVRRGYVERGAPGLADWRAFPLAGAGNRFSILAALVTAAATLLLGLLLGVVRSRAPGHVAAAPVTARRRRAGGIALACGSLVCVTGLAVAGRSKTLDVRLRDGEAFTAKDPFGRTWTLTSQGASRIQRSNHFAVGVALLAARDGVRQGFISAEQRAYVDSEERDRFPRVTVPGILGTILEDVYVVVTDAGSGRADLRVSFIALVAWIWIGGGVAAAGAAIALWPGPDPEEAGT